MKAETMKELIDRCGIEHLIEAVSTAFAHESLASTRPYGNPETNAREVSKDRRRALAYAITIVETWDYRTTTIDEVLEGVSPMWEMTGNLSRVRGYGTLVPRPDPDTDGGLWRTLYHILPLVIRARVEHMLHSNDRRDGPRDEWEDELPEEVWTWECAVQTTTREAERLAEGLGDEALDAVRGQLQEVIVEGECRNIMAQVGVRSLAIPGEAAAAYRLCPYGYHRTKMDHWVREALERQDPMYNNAQEDWKRYRELCQ